MAGSTGHSQITGLNTAKTLGSIPASTAWALIQPVTQDVYVTFNGSTPASTNGIRVVALSVLKVKGSLLTNVKVIEAAASATLNVAFFGAGSDVELFK